VTSSFYFYGLRDDETFGHKHIAGICAKFSWRFDSSANLCRWIVVCFRFLNCHVMDQRHRLRLRWPRRHISWSSSWSGSQVSLVDSGVRFVRRMALDLQTSSVFMEVIQ
jgi:hypothetical protein